MSYEDDPLALARAVLDGTVHRQPNGDFFIDHVVMLAREVVRLAPASLCTCATGTRSIACKVHTCRAFFESGPSARGCYKICARPHGHAGEHREF